MAFDIVHPYIFIHFTEMCFLLYRTPIYKVGVQYIISKSTITQDGSTVYIAIAMGCPAL